MPVPHPAAATTSFADLNLNIRYLVPASLTALGRRTRRHPAEQIKQIANSIQTFGFTVPVIVDEDDRVIAGNARVEAAVQLGMATIPVVRVAHLSAAAKRAFVIAENQLATKGNWDKDVLRVELQELRDLDLDFDLDVIGFSDNEIDAIILGDESKGGPGGKVPEVPATPTSRLGDLWRLGDHRLYCGDSTDAASLVAVLDGEKARTVFTDIPYNVPIGGHVTGGSAHGEFVMASGEMSEEAFATFMTQSFEQIAASLVAGGLAYFCIDWRSMETVFKAVAPSGLELLNLIVWDKGVGGMGSFYRSRHELIFLYRKPGAPHLNRVELGRHGRNRSNVWAYEGVNGFGADKAATRALHPTVKNLSMVRDAILDSTARGDLVLDLFSGSGTTIIAAHEAGRRGAAIDLDPRYVDTGVLRWQGFSGQEARLAATGQSFLEVRNERQLPTALPPARTRTRTRG